jgi:hypothetical protein
MPAPLSFHGGRIEVSSWVLPFFEFWSYEVRNARLRDEFDRRRRAVRDVVAKC